MEGVAWLVAAIVVAACTALIVAAPALKRRQLDGGGSALSGVAGGLDGVWRPTANEARADWEAQVEMPAPSPAPGDPGRVRDGRITIDLDT
jgi:hypothetical protein